MKFDQDLARISLSGHFGTRDLRGFGCDESGTRHWARPLPCSTMPRPRNVSRWTSSPGSTLARADDRIHLDPHSRRNLEIDRRLDGSREQTLYALLNRTRHAHGRPPADRVAERPATQPGGKSERGSRRLPSCWPPTWMNSWPRR
jgi:DNA mismatch repair protein MutS